MTRELLFVIISLAVSGGGCATARRPSFSTCTLLSLNREPPILECTKPDGTDFLLEIKNADGMVCFYANELTNLPRCSGE